MVIVGFFLWWYGDGWARQVRLAREHIVNFFDYFSIDLLIRTYFSPFRQISAGSVQGPIGLQIRAFFDQLVSRVIGATVRGLMIVVGAITILLTILIELVRIILWAVVPLAPIIGLIVMFTGWLPWTA